MPCTGFILSVFRMSINFFRVEAVYFQVQSAHIMPNDSKVGNYQSWYQQAIVLFGQI